MLLVLVHFLNLLNKHRILLLLLSFLLVFQCLRLVLDLEPPTHLHLFVLWMLLYWLVLLLGLDLPLLLVLP